MKKEKGITLIALIVTIIILIILAGITIALISGGNGIMSKATAAVDKNNIETAKEQVTLKIGEYQTEFYEKRYVTLEIGNEVQQGDWIYTKYGNQTIDTKNYQFKIEDKLETDDKYVVRIIKNRKLPGNVTGTLSVDGKLEWDNEISDEDLEGQENEEIKIAVTQNIDSDYVKGTLNVEITYEGTISEVAIKGEKVNISELENGVYTINKEIRENGNYNIVVKDENGNYKTENIKVTEITEDMEIWNRLDIEKFRDKVNSGRTFEGRIVQVMADIDLEGSEENQWTPIANTEEAFKGTFEGNNHTINQIYINSSSSYQGLFGINNGIIQNVKVDGNIKSSGVFIAGIAGYNYNTILNCCNNAYVQGTTYSGGITGYNTNLIQKCYNTNEIYATDDGAAGIAGCNLGTIKECYNTKYVHAVTQTAGGICGYNAYGKIYNSYNVGSVYAGSNVGGINGAEGLSGHNTVYTYNCYNLGSISGSNLADQITGWPNANGGSSQDVNCYSTDATAELLNSGEYSDDVWMDDTENINSGYPVLKWQVE